MYVRHLTVADFRSWPSADLALEPGTSVLVGSNGQGKTNLVEAIGYLSTLGSHRVSGDAALIRFGAERAIVRAAVVSEGRELRLEVELTAGRANKARLNGSPIPRPRELLGLLRTVLFAPEDLSVVRGDPAERRRFLDDLLVQRTPRLAGVRADYERVLKQRAALLKSAGAARRSGRTGDLSTLDVWDSHLATHGSQLIAARLNLLDALAPEAQSSYASVARASEPFTLSYLHSISTLDGSERDAGVIEAALQGELVRVRPQELDRGVNLIGPHRDDVELRLGPLPVRGYASHGEGWSAALALRLGSYELLRADGAEPVLILDDVFAELDASRREHLALVAGKAEQVLITAAVASDVPAELQGARYDVHGGEVHRVI
ncbi:DNA replication and repair protein RecF [Jatrophihabitans sp. GAS493]|uniref:DNA replication/repair protein RecF n=1 Tax=Jatrophihabitans sp. GAS493 TaxID=1907575 RepID=UPI000BB8E1A8|nr:DNA replication/repair protein RecF [Jatrophihabitans sp. GAS493]SOD71219.1 DNA replication and repair protein RecF [Jatrophihabitans sp. GAS493]